MLCGLSALLSTNRVILNPSCAEWSQGNGAWPPAVDQTMARCASAEGGCASHPATGSIQVSWAVPQNPHLRQDKNGSSNHRVTFEDLPERIQVPADTNSPKSFFCATGSTVYTRSKTARSHVGSSAVSSVPQLSSLQREREAEPSPTKTSANQPGLLVA